MKIANQRPLNPLNDGYIKYLLGSEENKDLLLSLINAVFLDKGMAPITWVEVLNPFTPRDLDTQKEIRLDVKARDEEGRFFNIEIQRYEESAFSARSLYYWSANFFRQLKQGRNYRSLQPVICINLLDFSLSEGLPRPHSCFVVMEKDTRSFRLTEHLEIHFIEISRYLAGNPASPSFEPFPRENANSSGALGDNLAGWCYYFQYEGDETAMNTLTGISSIFRKAHQAYQRFTWDDAKMLRAVDREMAEHDKAHRESIRRETEEAYQTAARNLADTEEKLTDTEEKLTDTEEKLTDTEEKLTDTEERLSESEEKRRKAEAARREALAEKERFLQEQKRMVQKLRDEGLSEETVARITGLSQEEVTAL